MVRSKQLPLSAGPSAPRQGRATSASMPLLLHSRSPPVVADGDPAGGQVQFHIHLCSDETEWVRRLQQVQHAAACRTSCPPNQAPQHAGAACPAERAAVWSMRAMQQQQQPATLCNRGAAPTTQRSRQHKQHKQPQAARGQAPSTHLLQTRPAPRRSHCPRFRTPGGAGPAAPCCLCTCPAACAPAPGLAAPGGRAGAGGRRQGVASRGDQRQAGACYSTCCGEAQASAASLIPQPQTPHTWICWAP